LHNTFTLVSYLEGGLAMDPAEKTALKEKLAEKGIDFDKAAEELKVTAPMLTLYLMEDSNPVPKRIIDGLNKMIES
jgi:predicted transcriptional regulator